MKAEQRTPDLLSVVLPVFNEADVLQELTEALESGLQQLFGKGIKNEILFVNDGSTDSSGNTLDRLAATKPNVRVVHLSRNFGHQSAVHAGLFHARGDAVIVMDSDMQDEPGRLADFVSHWQLGYDVVYAVRVNRKENWLKRMLFRAFYRVLNCVSTTTIPNDAGIFSLMDRKVVDQIIRLNETDRYLPGLRHWVGFRQIGLPVERNERHDDRPRVSLYGLFQLAKTALFSFSRVPLSSFYAIASVSVLVCLGCISFTLYHKLFTGLAIPGWTSITIIGSFFGAINALGIGVLGEYVVRIYDQVRNRPKYIVDRRVNFGDIDFESERLISEEIAEIRQLIDELDTDSSRVRKQHKNEKTLLPPVQMPTWATDLQNH